MASRRMAATTWFETPCFARLLTMRLEWPTRDGAFMNFEEHAAKSLVLNAAGIPVPRGILCISDAEAAMAAAKIGPCVVKAQVPAGKRGKAGGIKLAGSPDEAKKVARQILGMRIGDYTVERVLVEEQAKIVHEFYAAVLHDVAARKPLILFSTEGGMDIEEVAAAKPAAIRRLRAEIDSHPSQDAIAGMLKGLNLGGAEAQIVRILDQLYAAFRARDAELLEINPLALLADGRVVALDCKFVLDDAAVYRQPEIAKGGAAGAMTALEKRGADAGLKLIQLDGNVGVLANGAGLDHDYHGRHPSLRWQAGELSGNRRRGLHKVGNCTRPGAFQSGRQKPSDQFLRCLCAY